MNKPTAITFFVLLGIVLMIAYGYLPAFIIQDAFYSKLLGAVFLLGILSCFLIAITIGVKE